MSIKKHWWIIAVGCIIIGGIMFALSWGLGARGGNIYIDENGLHITSSDSKQNGESKMVVNEKNLEKFNRIKITASSEDVKFIQSDHYGLEIFTSENPDKTTWKLENNQLTVETKDTKSTNHINFFNFGVTNSHDKYIKVYYPQNASFESTVVDSSSGNINLSDFKTKNLEVEVSYGDVDISIIDCDNIKSHTNSGKIWIKNSNKIPTLLDAKSDYGDIDIIGNLWNSVKVKTSSGNIKIQGDLQGESNVDTDYGNIELRGNSSNSLKAKTSSGDIKFQGQLQGKTAFETNYGNIKIQCANDISKYAYDATTDYGIVKINGEEFGKTAKTLNSNNAENKIIVKTSSGDIKIDFNK